jgi:recombinational DNA repair ATPase RecF
MRITAATISDFKRVRSVEIRPAADRTLILIAGKNAQGKSSVLDALTAAFGGKKALPAEAVRRGAGQADITVELDDGALTIHRVIERDGPGYLEVRDQIGARRSPQTVLDQLVGQRFLDPLAFLAMPAKEQRAVLMSMIKEATRIAQLDAERERVFDRRTEISRELTKAKGELDAPEGDREARHADRRRRR